MGFAATVVLLAVTLIEVAVAIAFHVMSQPTAQETDRRREIRHLKVEMREYRAPDGFVKESKIRRQIIALEKEIGRFQEERAVQKIKVQGIFSKLRYGLLCGLAIIFWQAPLLQLPRSSVWPFGMLLSFPGFSPGSIGVVAGLSLVQQGSARVLKIILGA